MQRYNALPVITSNLLSPHSSLIVISHKSQSQNIFCGFSDSVDVKFLRLNSLKIVLCLFIRLIIGLKTFIRHETIGLHVDVNSYILVQQTDLYSFGRKITSEFINISVKYSLWCQPSTYRSRLNE